MNPLISIVVPVYNVEMYLGRCIDSILAQTYQNIEIIPVDDGATDRSGQICDEYAMKDARIRVIHKKNGGLSSARNAGIDVASGEYLCFIDSDDVLDQAAIEKLYNAMVTHAADVAVCRFFDLNEEGYRIVKEEADSGGEPFVLSGTECMEYNYSAPDAWFVVTATNKLYRREIFSDLRFEHGKIHEDEFAFHKVMLQCERVVILPDALYGYRKNSGGIMANRSVKSYTHAAEAFVRRGIDTLGLLDAKWHLIHLNAVFRNYRMADSLAKTDEARAALMGVRALILNYLRRLLRENPSRAALKYYLEFRFPRPYLLLKKPFLKWKGLFRWLRFKKEVLSSDILILNTATHGNLGDHAIVLAELAFLGRYAPEKKVFQIVGKEFDRYRNRLKKILPKKTLICINGGGDIGNLWPNEEIRQRKIIEDYPCNRIIFFPQTATFDLLTEDGRAFFEESKKTYSAHRSLTVFAREENTYAFMKKYMPDVDCVKVPDIVLSYRYEVEERPRKNILFCLRADVEKAITKETIGEILAAVRQSFPNDEIIFTDTVLDREVDPSEREIAVSRKLRQFSGTRLVITDRLHGMVFAYLTKTPCVALSNCNGKVKHVYEWIKDCPYIQFADSAEEVKTALAACATHAQESCTSDFADAFRPLSDILQENRSKE